MTLRNKITGLIRRIRKYLPGINRPQGNTLLYIVLVMVIFGMLGATMVSLFTASTVSTTTLNEDRRARYLYESAGRYAMSELRTNDFSASRINDLNSTTHSLGPNGTFDLNIYSLWFRSTVTVNLPLGDPLLRVDTEEGEIPDDVINAIPSGNIYVVNMESAETDFAGNLVIPANNPNSTAVMNGIIKNTATQYRIGITEPSDNTFSVNAGDRVCFAVRPTTFQSLSAGSNLKIHQDARFIFPKNNGIVYIKTKPVIYERAVYYPGSRVELTNISEAVTISSAEYVVLWPGNHWAKISATVGNVTYEGELNDIFSVADTDDLTLLKYGSPKPDIDADDFTDNLTEVEDSSKTAFVDVDTTDDELIIGGSSGPVFGGAWYDKDKSVGGVTNFCTQGECKFGLGIRTFFTFTKTGGGNGFIYSLINGLSNDKSSIGGDIATAEMLGYAGDSRLVPSPSSPPSTDFLDGKGEGIEAPKFGLEFDTVVNYDAAFELNQDYCSGSTLISDTRNDPLSGSRDAVQYVFWGRDDFINIPCRDPSPGRDTYDDNRHDAVGLRTQEWQKPLEGSTPSWVEVGQGGTVYVGAPSQLWAFEPDGDVEWQFTDPVGNVYSPTVGSDGTVYAGAADGKLWAINPSGTKKWETLPTGDAITTKPAIDSNGIIYVGSNDDSVYAYNTDGSMKWQSANPVPQSGDYNSSPALSADESTLFIGSDNNRLYAIWTADGTERWNVNIGGNVESSPAVASDGTIYVGSYDGGLYAINDDGSLKWATPFQTGAQIEGSPAIGQDGTIYIGSNDRYLYAVNPDKTEKHPPFLTGSDIDSTPILDASDNIYFGSDDNIFYALYNDLSLKWDFNVTAETDNRPAIGTNGFVYVASRDGNLRALNQFAGPRNYRQNIPNPIEPEEGQNLIAYNAAEALEPYPAGFVPTSADDWIKSGPWAVRFDVSRNTLGDGSGDYILRAWMYQCGNNDCSDILGTFFENTRTNYDPGNIPPQLVQTFNLDNVLNPDFDRFLFGFTSAKNTGDSQVIRINNFQLSFIRPNDAVRTDPFIP